MAERLNSCRLERLYSCNLFADMLFAVMMSKPDDDDDYSNAENENTVLTSATQTLDLLAMHLPPEKLIPHLVSFRIIC